MFHIIFFQSIWNDGDIGKVLFLNYFFLMSSAKILKLDSEFTDY